MGLVVFLWTQVVGCLWFLRFNIYPDINQHKPPTFPFRNIVSNFFLHNVLVLISVQNFKGNIKNQPTFPLYTPLKTNMEPQNWFLFGGIFKFHVSIFFLGVHYGIHPSQIGSHFSPRLDRRDATRSGRFGLRRQRRRCYGKELLGSLNEIAQKVPSLVDEGGHFWIWVRRNPVSTTNPDSTTLTQRMMRVFFFEPAFCLVYSPSKNGPR